MRLYFDVCALGRLSDDPDQARIKDEANAVLACLAGVLRNEDEWISSVALEEEVSRNADLERRLATQALLRTAHTVSPYTPAIRTRASHLQQFGFGNYDSLHIAFAESVQADVLLTTDDRMVKLSQRLRSGTKGAEIRVAIANPVDWLAQRTR